MLHFLSIPTSFIIKVITRYEVTANLNIMFNDLSEIKNIKYKSLWIMSKNSWRVITVNKIKLIQNHRRLNWWRCKYHFYTQFTKRTRCATRRLQWEKWKRETVETSGPLVAPGRNRTDTTYGWTLSVDDIQDLRTSWPPRGWPL